MANHNLPTNTSTYTNVLTNLKDRMVDLARWLDPLTTSATNIPANSYRINALALEKYVSSAWTVVGRWLSNDNDTALGSLGLTALARAFVLKTTAADASDTILAQTKRNILHNSNFSYAQVTKSNRDIAIGAVTTTTPAYIVDRWAYYSGSTGVFIRGAQTTGANGWKNNDFTLTTASSNTATPSHYMRQVMPLEYLRQFAGKSLCFSVKIPSSSTLTAATVRITKPDGTTLIEGTVLNDAYVTFALPALTDAIWGSSNTPYFLITMLFTYSSAVGFVTIRQPMLNVGTTPAPYEYTDDSSACKRLYQSFSGFQFSGVATAANQDFRFSFPLHHALTSDNITVESLGGTLNLVNCTLPSTAYLDAKKTMLIVMIRSSAAGDWLADFNNNGQSSGYCVRSEYENI